MSPLSAHLVLHHQNACSLVDISNHQRLTNHAAFAQPGFSPRRHWALKMRRPPQLNDLKTFFA